MMLKSKHGVILLWTLFWVLRIILLRTDHRTRKEQGGTMMTKRIPLHSRVALREGADNVYSLALPGTQGWVRDHRVDEDGFEMVAIEWDTDHWRYNGQPDGWTFAEHFEVIGAPEPPVQEAAFEDSPELPEPGPSDDQIEDYIDTITNAMDAASEGEGFFMVTIRRMTNPENPNETLFVPQIFMQATTQEAEVLLDVQLMECASATFQEQAMGVLGRYHRRDKR